MRNMHERLEALFWTKCPIYLLKESLHFHRMIALFWHIDQDLQKCV